MTSRDVFNRIRWDPRIESSKVTVGYEDRFRGIVELEFSDGKLERDVPWHRVKHFCYDGQPIWDRDGLDLLDSVLAEPAAVSSGCWLWDAQAKEWSAAAPSSICWSGALRLLTFNVLFDLYDKTVPTNQSRLPGLIKLLEETAADVICLQEVTTKLLRLLLAHESIRRRFHISHGPGAELAPYGQLLLARFAFTSETRPLVAGKTVLQANLPFESGPVELVALHLHSDRSGDGSLKRRQQLEEILAYLPVDAPAWLVGDFNHSGLWNVAGFRDLWSALRPADYGLTFNAATNTLAGKTSSQGTQARFDRILIRGPWAASSVALPVVTEGLSDHEPLLAELLPPELEAPVHTSALVVLPPEDCWPPIQAIREKHDKSYYRWMPHINLLYGFVPEECFEEAVERLTPLLHSMPSFRIRLREFRRFQHRGSTTVWLSPECQPPEALEKMQKALQAHFPDCTEQDRHGDSGFTPHLTVASLKAGVREPRMPQVDLEFRVDSLALICRRDEDPFEVRHRLSLGGQELAPLLPPREPRREAWSALRREVEDRGARLFPVGSGALDLGLPWSDMDALVVGHRPAEEALAGIEGRWVPGPASANRKTAVPTRSPARDILTGGYASVPFRVRVLRGSWQGQKLDLQYAMLPADCALDSVEELPDDRLQSLPEETRRALNARREVAALDRLVNRQRLAPLLRVVRCWTHARCLDLPPAGFPGGWGWTMLVAHVLLQEKTEENVEELLRAFFERLDAWPWPRPLSLGKLAEYKVRQNDRFPVLTQTSPQANLAANVTGGTLRLLQHEIRRGHALAAAGHWQELLAPVERGQGVEWTLSGPTREEALGWMESNLLTWMLTSEEAGCPLRPFAPVSKGNEVRSWFEVLGRLDRASLRRFQASLDERFPGVGMASQSLKGS